MPTGIYQHKSCTEKTKKKIGLANSKTKIKIICKICNKKFEVHKSQIKNGGGKYCSQKCNSISKKGIISPLKGIKTGRIPKSAFKKGCISLRKGKKFPQLSSKNHWNWKGGITPENKKIRELLEIKLWRKANMERDNFSCQKCEIIGGKLQIHHINNFADFPELRTSISNGITLCKNCHKEFHKKYSKRNNSREQLEKFLI